MLQAHQRTCAPRAIRVSIRTCKLKDRILIHQPLNSITLSQCDACNLQYQAKVNHCDSKLDNQVWRFKAQVSTDRYCVLGFKIDSLIVTILYLYKHICSGATHCGLRSNMGATNNFSSF